MADINLYLMSTSIGYDPTFIASMRQQMREMSQRYQQADRSMCARIAPALLFDKAVVGSLIDVDGSPSQVRHDDLTHDELLVLAEMERKMPPSLGPQKMD